MHRRTFLIPSMVCLVLALAWSGRAASAEETTAEGQLSLFADVGNIDNRDWNSWFIQPGVELANYQDGLNVSVRGRALFSQDEDFTDNGLDSTGKINGWDTRAMVGLGLASDRGSAINLLIGAGYYYIKEEQDLNALDTNVSLTSKFATAEVGARLGLKLFDSLDWVSMVTGGPIFWGEADADSSVLGGFVDTDGNGRDIDNGWVAEARTGLDLYVSRGLALHGGVSYEHLQYDLKGIGDERKLDKLALHVGLLFRF